MIEAKVNREYDEKGMNNLLYRGESQEFKNEPSI